MHQLSDSGLNAVNSISQQSGFSPEAVTHMLYAVLNGGGTMAQFGHPEFGGSGQWMQGGMLMLSDLFNHNLKNRVDNLCYELSNLMASDNRLLKEVAQAKNWWPEGLGIANATGGQNTMRYAYFANENRLAIDTNGEVWVYDTLDHQIGGFSQQQGLGGSIQLSSQYGNVNLNSLPVVSINGAAVNAPNPEPTTSMPPVENTFVPETVVAQEPSAQVGTNQSAAEADIFQAIERLGELFEKDILTSDEFSAKKTELLKRL